MSGLVADALSALYEHVVAIVKHIHTRKKHQTRKSLFEMSIQVRWRHRVTYNLAQHDMLFVLIDK